MFGTRLIGTLRLTNFLSFGADSDEVELEPLNVLIGPNASGKSNVIEAMSLLSACPRDLGASIRQGGGVAEWLWKGADPPPEAELDVTLNYPDSVSRLPLRYRLRFGMVGQRLQVTDEAIENERPAGPHEHDVYFYYRYQAGDPVLNVFETPAETGDGTRRDDRTVRRLRRETLDPEQSVLSQRRDPDLYPEVTFVGKTFSEMRFYREWNLGRYTAARMPQKPDAPQDFLLEDASNLGLVLNDLEHRGEPYRELTRHLAQFYRGVDHLSVRILGGTVQLFLHEKGLAQPVPATRLSDGTIRYICLLSILCHPEPPPLVCLEEPELGLHPDVLPPLAELMVDAARRTQLIVTTHSDILVSALTDHAESVLVCERGETGTTLTRHDPERLKKWLEDYTLGELWRMGELGGNL